MTAAVPTLPDFAAVLSAAARIAPHAQRTPVLHSHSLDDIAGCELHFKCENLQRVGAFKFRGACNAIFALDEGAAARGILTQSSGNHGAAVANNICGGNDLYTQPHPILLQRRRDIREIVAKISIIFFA